MGRSRSIDSIIAEMQEWPEAWSFRAGDLPAAEALVRDFTPFLRHLHAGGMALSTIERHRNCLGHLGLTIMEDRQDNPPTRRLPPLLEFVEEEGGPLSNHRQDDTEHRRYHATCKKLYRFLSEAVTVTPRRKAPSRAPRRRSLKRLPQVTRSSVLEAMVEEATIDANSQDEVIAAFLCLMEEHLACPFHATVLGQQVTVPALVVGADGSILALCHAGPHRQRIPLLELALSKPLPAGHRWIEAYRRYIG